MYFIPFLSYWGTVLFVETVKFFKYKEENDIKNEVDRLTVFTNTTISTLFMTLINFLISYYEIVEKERMSLWYILLGIWMIDTIEYIYHYALHKYAFLYKHVHKIHHQLHHPYSYSALYNHTIEGMLEMILILSGYLLFQFSFNEIIIVTSLANVATVLDHSFLTWKKGFHMIHHNGNMNYNFQQPFFTYYDQLFGTYMIKS